MSYTTCGGHAAGASIERSQRAVKALLVALFVVGYTAGDLEFTFPALVAGWAAVALERYTNIIGRS